MYHLSTTRQLAPNMTVLYVAGILLTRDAGFGLDGHEAQKYPESGIACALCTSAAETEVSRCRAILGIRI